MKALLIAIAVVVGMVMILSLQESTTMIQNEREVIKEVEVTPTWAEDEDAVKAAQDVIRRKELQAEREQLNTEVKERNERLKEIEKELGF